MTGNWLILADDLTGAADSAVAFAKRGIDACVTWGDGVIAGSSPPAVIAYNSATRELTAAAAIATQRAVLGKLLCAGTTLFKKIDSTLRGQPAAEIRVLCDFLRERRGNAFGIVAPAYPALGRTTRESKIYVDGMRLEDTEVWSRDHTYPNADVLQLLNSVGLNAAPVSLAQVRGHASSLVARLRDIADARALAVCDALADEDLECIAAASRVLNIECFYVGSGGLAQALARSCDAPKPERDLTQAFPRAGTLIVVGSLARASRAAARELSSTPGVKYVALSAEALIQEYLDEGPERPERLVAQIIDVLEAGDDVLIEIVFAAKPHADSTLQLTRRLSSLIAPVAMRAGAIVATGGETAAAVLKGMNASGIRLIDEIEPGICLGFSVGARGVPVVTKAGAFGDEGTLVRVANYLRKFRGGG
jgi:uncharacterized protein YgbK (DUF1537 family)